MSFDRRTVAVTGAAGNLGRAVAAAFFDLGANLALFARRREELAKIYGEENERRVFVTADLLARAEVEAAVEMIRARFGRIDVLCNIAGGIQMGSPVHQTSDE